MRKINSEILIIILIMGFCIMFSMSAGVRGYGDGYSYRLMTDSLIKDKDLKVDKKDIARWNDNKFDKTAIGAHVLFDKKGTPRYAKPILYPLISVLFYFFGIRGFSLLNGLFLGGSIVFCYLFIRHYLNKINSIIIAVLFFFCSYIPVYVSWIHPEMMLFFSCSLCMWLFFCKDKRLLAVLVVGIISSVKIVFLLLLVPFFAVMVSKKEYKQLSKSLVVIFLGIVFMLSLNFLLVGQISSYSGENRGFYVSKIDYNKSIETTIYPMVLINSQFEGFGFNSWKLFFKNLGNFFIGRFTGIVWYAFPAIVCIIVYLFSRRYLSKKERIQGDSILITIFLLIIILIFSRPLNYFGGIGFICNRYFFMLPALLFFPVYRRVKNLNLMVFSFLPGLFINFNIMEYEFYDKNCYFQKYSNTFIPGTFTCFPPLRYFPLEIVQIESFPVPNERISDRITLYFPLGYKKKDEDGVLMDKGQEIVIVENYENDFLLLNNNRGTVKNKLNLKLDMNTKTDNSEEFILRTDSGTVTLNPKVTLRNIKDKKYKRFYYFEVKKTMLIQLG